MATSLNVLIIEDSESDTELMIRMLKRSGFECSYKQIQTEDEMHEALNNHKWDIILSDYSMPKFNAMTALNMLHDTGLDIPFIVVSGVMGEDNAVSLIKAGANDYLMKNNLTRLIPSIHKEIIEAEIRQEKRNSQKVILKLEEQLRQSQKMEAVGKLAGGIAHDFNNLLFVISGSVEMLMHDIMPKTKLYEQMQRIMKASQRGAKLVNQLLLFSRKEIMQPRLIDINEFVGNLVKTLKKTIGENINLEVHTTGNLNMILADSKQIEQVLINICINARDAMPDKGGDIKIETENVSINSEFCKKYPWAKEGEYVMLAISDNGYGIPHEIQDQVFEPFFTTKEVGKGTGLGLAAVYGIVQAHNGIIHLESKQGHGTVFKIYIPSVKNKPDFTEDFKTSVKPVIGGNETILIAEDEDDVRKLITTILENKGYRVIAAQDGEEAINLFEKHLKDIQIALLDVVMPKASGPKVFERIKFIKPDMPVIFLTGYSKNMLPQNISQYEIIQKPFSSLILLGRIREILDNK